MKITFGRYLPRRYDAGFDPTRPVLAELSGGMDSSSIVCMANLEMSRGAADTTRLDTLSYFDDSEPGWNEYPYFTKVEEKLGRVGCHIDVSSHQALQFAIQTNHFAATPTSGRGASRRKPAVCGMRQIAREPRHTLRYRRGRGNRGRSNSDAGDSRIS